MKEKSAKGKLRTDDGVKSSRHWYMEVTLCFSDKQIHDVSALKFKTQITTSMKQVFGEAGAAIPIDILRFNPSSTSAVLRCPTYGYVKVRGALALISDCGGFPCVFKVKRATPSLPSLMANSRTYVH